MRSRTCARPTPTLVLRCTLCIGSTHSFTSPDIEYENVGDRLLNASPPRKAACERHSLGSCGGHRETLRHLQRVIIWWADEFNGSSPDSTKWGAWASEYQVSRTIIGLVQRSPIRNGRFQGVEMCMNPLYTRDDWKWWAQRDLNPRPSDYESPALTTELWAQPARNKRIVANSRSED